MPFDFNQIPANISQPLAWLEVRPAQTPYAGDNRLLLIGHKWTYSGADFGTAALDTVYPMSGDDAVELFGPGSILDSMYRIARRNAPFADIRGIALTEPAGARAFGVIECSTAPSSNRSGALNLRIAGVTLSIDIKATDTATQVIDKIRSKVNTNAGLPCYAVRFLANYPSAGGAETTTKVRLLCKHLGSIGNDIRIETSWDRNTNKLANKLLTVTQFSGGTLAPSFTAGLAAIGDQPYSTIVNGLGTAGGLSDLESFMYDRWAPQKKLYGHVVAGAKKSYANALTWAADFNDPHLTVMTAHNAPQPPWVWGAGYGAVLNFFMDAPPRISRPVQARPILGLLPPGENDQFDIAECEALLNAGLASYDVSPDNKVRVSRAVTTYKTSAWGVSDRSWRDSETMYQTAYFARSMESAIVGNYPNAALTDEDRGIPAFLSPGRARDLVIHEYKRLERIGLVERSDLFAQVVDVQRDEVDPNRLNFFLPPDFVNQFRIAAVLVETHLQLKDSWLLEGADVTDPTETA